jgi:hypothetical protein
MLEGRYGIKKHKFNTVVNLRAMNYLWLFIHNHKKFIHTSVDGTGCKKETVAKKITGLCIIFLQGTRSWYDEVCESLAQRKEVSC